MIYLLKMVMFHGYVSQNQMVLALVIFHGKMLNYRDETLFEEGFFTMTRQCRGDEHGNQNSMVPACCLDTHRWGFSYNGGSQNHGFSIYASIVK